MRVNILKNFDLASEVMSDGPNFNDQRDQQLLGPVLQKLNCKTSDEEKQTNG